ncbi:MAG: hypothetical protein JWO36_3861 [Myxococcales bacterium]|nr:hypothetical protein [Myxococcales bacterium]
MRVLYDHQIFSYQRFGGASRYFCELMNAFHRDGEPTFDLGVAESPNEYLKQASFYRGKTSSRTGTASFLRTYLRNEVSTRAAALRRRHDVMHSTFYDPAVLTTLRGAKLVVTILDMIPEHFPDDFVVTGLYGRFVTKRWIEGKRALCRRADVILAISEHTKQDVIAFYGIDPDRIVVTHLGNNISGRADLPVPGDFPSRYILFVGTRNTYKNFVLFIEAVAPLVVADSSLGVVCIGGGSFTPAERELCDRRGLGEKILQRSVADGELAACYAHAVAFVFPSRYEGFGIPILEAFACGCPVLVANASCFPEIAGDAALYFDVDDPQSLRAQLATVVGDAALRAGLMARGIARARQFSWQTTARKTLDAYRSAMGGEPSVVAS